MAGLMGISVHGVCMCRTYIVQYHTYSVAPKTGLFVSRYLIGPLLISSYRSREIDQITIYSFIANNIAGIITSSIARKNSIRSIYFLI